MKLTRLSRFSVIVLVLLGLTFTLSSSALSIAHATTTSTPLATTPNQEPGTNIVISPLRGPVGTTVHVIADGFPPNADVVIGMGPVDSEYDVLARATTTSTGTVFQDIQVPSYAIPNDNWVIVVETEDLVTDAVSKPFLISEPIVTNGPLNATITPTNGPAGTPVTLVAGGFPSNASVIIGVRRLQSEFAFSLRDQTNDEGIVTAGFSIPADATYNSNWIVLVQLEDFRDVETTSNIFTVTGVEPTAPPTGTFFERADIYLIALNDGGVSGIPVGCNDSLVPIQVTFPPTVAPLTASLEQMLSDTNRFYGQSGLYNALWQSDLTLDGINIEDRVATINLSGSLSVGGACDAPRIQSQIEQTALQYSTIDAVEININQVPIEDMLSTIG